MNKHYHIRLADEQRRELKRLVECGRKLARKITRARILLLADTGKTDREIAEALQICTLTAHNVRKRFFDAKSINSLEEKPRSGKPPKLEGLTAAYILGIFPTLGIMHTVYGLTV